ncbi:MAG: nucleotidyltransferase domain-containing protein [Cyanobacteria bacterium P01_F01_bin.53]
MTAQSVPHLPTILRQRLRVSAAEIVTFCQRWHVEELGLFGSVIRNDFGPESDIDVLVVLSHRIARFH